MSPERWRQVEKLFHLALERPEARPALLSSADPELRADVESLLAQQTGDHIFEHPVFPERNRVVPGAMLGPYRIEILVGEGGMGQVFRAVDTRLDRKVAIKISSRELSERSGLEARAISALNHPHICTLHDVGPDYLVMEYLEGETLAQRIRKGPLPMSDVLRYGSQIADALAEAHSKGITHRDLKPGNIMIGRSGIKVLDFGVATFNIAGDPRVGTGPALGTPAYMAPEQRDGKDVDGRTDIYALGLVLYEAATGKRAAPGQLPSLDGLPDKFAHVVERCLAQEAEDRWQSARDVKAELDWAAKSQPFAPTAPRRFVPRWAWVGGVSGVIAALGWSFSHLNSTRFGDLPQAPPVSSTLLPPPGAQFDLVVNPLALPALSPDGTHIVFGLKTSDGKHQLWLRRLDSPNPQLLSGTEDGIFPFWSPDSRWVGFGQGKTLLKIDIHGGPAVVVTQLPQQLRGATWSPAGVIVFGLTGEPAGLSQVPAAGGLATPVTVLEPGRETAGHRYPWFLPDGRHFLYTSQQAGDIPVRVGSLDEPSKPGKIVAQAQSFVRYAEGHLLFLRQNTLMAQPFDADKLRTTGEALPLAEGVPVFTQPSRAAAFTVSAGRMVVYQSSTMNAQSRLEWKDSQGTVLSTMGAPTGRIDGITLTSGTNNIVVTHREHAGSTNLWIYDAARGVPTRFTFDPEHSGWSPDGDTVYFNSNRLGHAALFRKSSSGNGVEELVVNVSADPTSISPDGKHLLFTRLGESTGRDLWVVPLTPEGAATPRPFLNTSFEEQSGQFSPAGKPGRQWIAYTSNESGQTEVYASPFSGSGGKRQISSGGGLLPLWRRDGRELFYVSRDGQLIATEVLFQKGTLEPGRTRKLFSGLITAGDRGLTYGISPDGQKVLVVVDDGAPDALPLILLQNWPAALRK